MSSERRSQEGIAIVTMRPRVMKRVCRQARMPARMLTVQPGPAWPPHRPPIVLDTIGLDVATLVALLASVPHTPTDAPEPFIALAEPHETRTLRLLALCGAVWLICAPNLAQLRSWLADLPPATPAAPIGTPLWLLPPPPALHLEPLLLPALAALRVCPSYAAAALRCGVSEPTLLRLMRRTRATLGVPQSPAVRYRPEVLAALILARLGDDAGAA